jgi:eukaryotic-like serine/threonine-protein kinase
MALKSSDKLGPYEILAPIGKGGTGGIWKARDPRVGRDVAITVSAARFGFRLGNPRRLAGAPAALAPSKALINPLARVA